MRNLRSRSIVLIIFVIAILIGITVVVGIMYISRKQNTTTEAIMESVTHSRIEMEEGIKKEVYSYLHKTLGEADANGNIIIDGEIRGAELLPEQLDEIVNDVSVYVKTTVSDDVLYGLKDLAMAEVQQNINRIVETRITGISDNDRDYISSQVQRIVLSDISRSMSSVQNSINANKSSIDASKSAMTKLQTQSTTLQNNITAINSALQTLQQGTERKQSDSDNRIGVIESQAKENTQDIMQLDMTLRAYIDDLFQKAKNYTDAQSSDIKQALPSYSYDNATKTLTINIPDEAMVP